MFIAVWCTILRVYNVLIYFLISPLIWLVQCGARSADLPMGIIHPIPENPYDHVFDGTHDLIMLVKPSGLPLGVGKKHEFAEEIH